MKPKRRYKKSKCCIYNEQLYCEGLEKEELYLAGMTIAIAKPMTDEARKGGQFFNIKTPFDWLVYSELENHFLWIWRFLFTWGWNGKKQTFSLSFYKKDMETSIWTIGDY